LRLTERFLDDKGVFLMAAAGSASNSTSKANATNGTTPADVEKQLEVLRQDVTELTKQVADLISHAKDQAMAQVKSQVRSAKSQVDSAISDAQASGREAVDAFRDVADTFGDAVEDSLKKRPYATLAMVAGIGFLFGAAWRR
jgi:ElaB/YqjD/DUF883 family membrane-anchored ribosome-binding protein